MMSVTNDVGGAHHAIPSKDLAGRDVLVAILKLTFIADARGEVSLVADDPAEVDLVDGYHGDDPARASIRRPSQLFDAKPGTDVILLGHAHPTPGQPSAAVDVALQIGPIHKRVRAHGPRVWQRGGVRGIQPGPARPITEPIPLIYELAWGGMNHADPLHPRGEERNYVGRGLDAEPAALVGQPAAQLESLEHPVATSRQPEPASFGPIHRHWQPRCRFAGTFDERWMKTRMPLLPEDFDTRYHIAVPHDQWSPKPLRSDEPIGITGATSEGVWRFRLPRVHPGFTSKGPAGVATHPTHLDTILIDADTRRVELSWRASIPLPPKWELLEEVNISAKEILGAADDDDEE
jgi:hypothetical protein